jgi:catechol 2,3-dioxygenase-like lactoylglutathione lyase family enzyme
MCIEGLDHVQLAAPPGCEAEARRFFGQLLGLREVPKPPSLASRGGVWFSVGDQELHIGVQEPFVAAEKAHPALRVGAAGLESLAARLVGAGVEVSWDLELEGTSRFYAADPWGNRIELIAGSSPP